MLDLENAASTIQMRTHRLVDEKMMPLKCPALAILCRPTIYPSSVNTQLYLMIEGNYGLTLFVRVLKTSSVLFDRPTKMCLPDGSKAAAVIAPIVLRIVTAKYRSLSALDWKGWTVPILLVIAEGFDEFVTSAMFFTHVYHVRFAAIENRQYYLSINNMAVS